MSKVPNTIYSCLRLTGLTAALFAMAAASGCISAKSRPAEAAAPAVPAVLAETLTPTETVTDGASDDARSQSDALTSWIVARGEHLWGISAVDEVYNQAELWPLLYKNNLGQITDADLIYPGQVLEIPRNVSLSEINAAVEHARTRGAWALGPVELSDKEYLRR